jgi:hypothetical protein
MSRLPDLIINGGLEKLVERELVTYPLAETPAQRKARMEAGLPQPCNSFVVSRRVPVAQEGTEA